MSHDPGQAPYRQLAELSPQLAIAVDCLRQAKILLRSYLGLVQRLGQKNLLSGTKYDPSLSDLEDRLRTMDMEHAALWDKLDETRDLLRDAGLEVQAYEAIRAQVSDTVSGYQEQHTSEVGIFESRHESRWWVDPQQQALPTAALQALAQQLPPVSLDIAPDPEVEGYLRTERRGLLAWKLAVGLAVLSFVVGMFWLTCRGS